MAATLERGSLDLVEDEADDTIEVSIDAPPEPSRRTPRFERLGAVLQDPHVKFGQMCAAGALGFLIFTKFIFPAPNSILFQGAVLGSLSALIAFGTVLTY